MEDVTTHMRGMNSVFLKKWISERYGEDTLNQISAKVSSLAREMLESPNPNKWYATSLTKEIYEVLDRKLSPNNPDALVDFGRFSAELSIKGFLRYLTRLLTVQQLFKRAKAFWKSYNKGGSIETDPITEEEGRKKTTVYVRGTSGVGPQGCKVLEGYIEVLISRTGVNDIVIEKKTCIHKGDKTCSWRVSWS
ncbi:hypothetical protein JXM67_02900 [candidate division WOR-3 bacterium]|nr:hypothetical protein [candidate division WOR-3 bacterium]